jgi:hypothetical protein
MFMDQLTRCPVCDHMISLHVATGCLGLPLRKCRCKLTAEMVAEKARGLAGNSGPGR